MTTATQGNIITIEVEPVAVTKALPENFVPNQKDAGEGFSNLELSIPHDNDNISYQISFDGEGELLATVLNKPAGFSDEECDKLLQGFFMNDEDDEDEEEE